MHDLKILIRERFSALRIKSVYQGSQNVMRLAVWQLIELSNFEIKYHQILKRLMSLLTISVAPGIELIGVFRSVLSVSLVSATEKLR